MDHIYQRQHVVQGSLRKYTMSEIEDMAWPAACFGEDAPGLCFDLGPRR